MRNSDRAWLALAGGVAAYDLIATDNELLSDAARRYFKSQPVATASMILMIGLHLIGGLPHWCDPVRCCSPPVDGYGCGSDEIFCLYRPAGHSTHGDEARAPFLT